jgi:hypothetical protein
MGRGVRDGRRQKMDETKTQKAVVVERNTRQVNQSTHGQLSRLFRLFWMLLWI